MSFGIPREIKTNDNRVALTPSGAEGLNSSGYTVLVETGTKYLEKCHRARLAKLGWMEACRQDEALGLNIVGGKVTYPGVAEAFDFELIHWSRCWATIEYTCCSPRK